MSNLHHIIKLYVVSSSNAIIIDCFLEYIKLNCESIIIGDGNIFSSNSFSNAKLLHFNLFLKLICGSIIYFLHWGYFVLMFSSLFFIKRMNKNI